MAKCPICNVDLETDDTYDFEYDYEGIDLRVVGHCPNCERKYPWSEFAECVNWQVADLREV